MKFLFGNKDKALAPQPGPTTPPPVRPPVASKPTAVFDGKKQIIAGLIFISASFLGAVFVLYLTVNAQSEKEEELKDVNEKLVKVSKEKDQAKDRVQKLSGDVGRVMDLTKIVQVSGQVHGEKEADRREGTMWIDRKNGRCMVTLGALNRVEKGSRLAVMDNGRKIGVLKVSAALDIVSYAEPVDNNLEDFGRDYYQVKVQ